jgi:hypothetical protein
MAIRDLRLLTAILAVMIVIDALWNPIVLAWAGIFPEAFQTIVTPVASTADGMATAFKLATMILFSRWIYVAGKNLIAADVPDLEFTPGSRIWWFAIPIASLFKPYQGMRELWNASHDVVPYDINDNLVAAWWALWMLSLFAGSAFGLASGSDSGSVLLWAGCALDVVLGVVAILVIRGIAEAQVNLDGANLAEVFA